MKFNYLEIITIGRLLDDPGDEKLTISTITKRVNLMNLFRIDEIKNKVESMGSQTAEALKKKFIDVKLKQSDLKYLHNLYENKDWSSINLGGMMRKVAIDKEYGQLLIDLGKRLKPSEDEDE